jgi:hypothetical protein
LLILPELGRVTGGVVLLLGVLEVFEEVGIEDRRRDFVITGGPLAEVDGAAALGAERDFGGVEGNEFLADGAVEGFGHGRHVAFILLRLEGRAGWWRCVRPVRKFDRNFRVATFQQRIHDFRFLQSLESAVSTEFAEAVPNEC